uniref:Uncharacterized protein n=1 Tax=Oryza sativa subsp. japonica TaxID=39947 RepID=Q6KA58_ORYSJ|nr:hypothetical protein [Oryza sativa Japonica Group]
MGVGGGVGEGEDGGSPGLDGWPWEAVARRWVVDIGGRRGAGGGAEAAGMEEGAAGSCWRWERRLGRGTRAVGWGREGVGEEAGQGEGEGEGRRGGSPAPLGPSDQPASQAAACGVATRGGGGLE